MALERFLSLAWVMAVIACCNRPAATPCLPSSEADNAAPKAFETGHGKLQWLGGPTVLMERDGLRILTDPMLGPRSPHAFTLPRHPSTGEVNAPIARYTDPPHVTLAPLDAVILSHGHNDHFDQSARETLPKDVLVVIPPSIEAMIREAGFTNIRTLDWGSSFSIERGPSRLRITAVPAHHAHDMVLDAQVGKVNGYVLVWEGAEGRFATYWTGDSILFDGQTQALAPYGTIDLLLPHMGAVGSDGPNLRTMNADEAVALIQQVHPRLVVPIHHTTFGHYREPVSALIQRASAAGLADRVLVVPEGGVVSLPRSVQRSD